MKNENTITLVQTYVIEKNLKTSERGFVYLVRDKNTRQRYIYRKFSGSSAVYRRMCGLNCEYLPKIHGIWEDNGQVEVLEEYVQGDTLAFLLEGKCLSTQQAKKIIIQLCYALKALHGIGAVHRDIKPENVILRGEDAVLIDFDASRLCKAENSTDTQIMGTTGYAAPEQYGFSQTDGRTDIYALGILLNEMLTKSHPSRKLAEGDYRHVVEKCIQVNADQRYASVEEVINAMERPKPFYVKRGVCAAAAASVLFIVSLVISYQLGGREIQFSVVPEPEIYTREHVSISTGVWEGTADSFATPFQCDFDGDGISERYIFGVDYVDSPQESVVYNDINTCAYGDTIQREVFPCVWKIAADGSAVAAPELATCLTGARIDLWRTESDQRDDPEVWTTFQNWPGSIQVLYDHRHAGTWLYEAQAYLGDVKLTAQAVTSLYYSG